LPTCPHAEVAHTEPLIKLDRQDHGFVSIVQTSFDRLLAGMVAAGQGLEAICLFLGLTPGIVFDNVVRLGLRSPSDRPYRRPGPRGWSVLDTTRLIVWRLAGVHPETIGLRLGRSAAAVRAKARRLGVPAPPRSALHRLDPASLADPEPDVFRALAAADGASCASTPAELCGRAAGPMILRGGTGQPACVPAASSAAAAPLAPAARLVPERAATARSIAARGCGRRLERSPGQRELALPQVVRTAPRAATTAVASAPAKPAAVAPTEPKVPNSEAEVDFDNLRWVGHVKEPLKNRVVVWVLGMLKLGGLHWTCIPDRIAKTRSAAASLMTRADVPCDRDRSKFSETFNEAAARATLRASGYIVERDSSSGSYFWKLKTDYGVRHNRQYRRKLGFAEKYSSQEITLITARDLALRGAA